MSAGWLESDVFRARVPDAEWFQGTIPCQHTCPAHTDVPRYIKLIADGRFDEAYLVNQHYNVFPEILGRICARPCEPACRRGRIDRSVAICGLKRSAGDHKSFVKSLTDDLPSVNGLSRRVAVVGAGPSGLAAAQDLRKVGCSVTVYDALPAVGGMLVGGIPAWRLPRDVVRREIEDYFAALGVRFQLSTRIGRDVPLRDLLTDYDAVYLAAGTQTPQRLNIPGEDLTLVYPGLAFMEKVNLDAQPPAIGRRVAVIGGGFTAMDCSRSALRIGAEKVYVLYRRTKVEMPVDEYELEDAEVERVEFQYLVSPVAMLDDGKGGVGGLVCIRNRLGDSDASGRRSPVPIAGSEFTLNVDTVIAATGQVADVSWLDPELGIPTRGGRPAVDVATYQTGVSGLFAGGDYVFGARNVISAIADGRRAAMAIHNYLGDRRSTRSSFHLTTLRPYLMPRDYTEVARVRMPAVPPEQRYDAAKLPSWNLSLEVETGYSPELARREAQRCLQCNRNVTIDPEMCVICGRCVEYCPHDCIKLVPFGALEDAGGLDDLARNQLGKPLDSLELDSRESADPYEQGQAFLLDEDLCIRCGICEAVCPVGALQMKLFETEEVNA